MRISESTAKWLGAAAAAVAIVSFSLDFFNVDIVSNENRPPEIRRGPELARTFVSPRETIAAKVWATDADGDELEYFWGVSFGTIQLDRFPGPKATYVAPDRPGVDFIRVTVSDPEGATDQAFAAITIVEGGKVKSP
jgi:hypothetical protein